LEPHVIVSIIADTRPSTAVGVEFFARGGPLDCSEIKVSAPDLRHVISATQVNAELEIVDLLKALG